MEEVISDTATVGKSESNADLDIDTSKTEENPSLSPTENVESTSEERQQDDKVSTVPAEISFKRPMLGPFKRPSSSLKTKPGPTQQNPDLAVKKDTADPEKEIKTEVKDEEQTKATENDEDTSEKPHTKQKTAVLSPAEQLKQSQKAIPYLEPKWGGPTTGEYSLEVVKNGTIIDTVQLNSKSFHVFGRLPSCDIQLEHPSLSRYHAVLQYCAVPNDQHEIGWYLYDLDSTHGTSINKLQVKTRVYYRLRVGFVLKFAGSSRLHILQGPTEDQEEESDLTVTEMKEQKERKKMEEELSEKLSDKEPEEKKDTGCSWGMSDDAVDPEAGNPFAEMLPQNEELYLDDPKKTLKGFFEREGYDLPEYQFEEAGHGKHKCVVEVPVDSPTGQPVYAEAVVAGKRKDAVVACALEACRILDRYGLLRKKDHEAKKAKTRSWEENDYYSSDEDEFLDRTGEIQKKRELRMKRAGKLSETAETYESLTAKLEEVDSEMRSIEKQLEDAKKDSAVPNTSDLDALDAYMSSIKKGAIDTKTRMSLKRRMFDLKKEKGRLEKLVQIARPALLPKTASSSITKFGQMRGRIGGLTRKIGGGGRSISTGRISTSQPVSERTQEPPVKKDAAGDKTETTQTTLPTTKQPETTTESEQAIKLEDTRESKKMEQDQPVLDTDGVNDPETEKQTTTAEQMTRLSDERLSSNSAISDESTKKPETYSTQKQFEHDSQTTEGDTRNTSQETTTEIPSRKRTAETKKVKPKKPKTVVLSKDYADDDPDYAVWVPPQGQTGDGKTHLNAKYGY